MIFFLAMLDIWKHVTEVLAPWIQPLDNKGQVLSPWINSDAPLATTFLVTFTDVLLELYEQFKGSCKNKILGKIIKSLQGSIIGFFQDTLKRFSFRSLVKYFLSYI